MSMRTIDIALNVWQKRIDKLISIWAKSGADQHRQRRVAKIICALEKRQLDGTSRYNVLKELYAREKERIQHELIVLFCQNHECSNHEFNANSFATAVFMKNYKQGEHLCECCGNPLIAEHERITDDLLAELGF